MKRLQFTMALFSAIVLTLSATDTRAQQGAAIAGVDHVGMNVPDMKQAVAFFSDILGFTAVTQIGPVDLDSNWKKANHVHLNTGAVTIKMVRAGAGANIELFQYANNNGSIQQPGGDDIGATHIAFYTWDIHAAVAYLKSKGVTVLGDPFLMPVGDTKGESFVYFLTPWGAKLELVTYPEGKGYEKERPGTILWSPKNVVEKNNQKNITMSTDEVNKLVEQHLAIWNEKDTAKSKALLAVTYAADVEIVDHNGIVTGTDKVEGLVSFLHAQNKGFLFTHENPADAHHNVARLFWKYGPKENPAAITGMDMFVFENGKVSKLYIFVDAHK